MKKYIIKFEARTKGAIGKFYKFTEKVQAETLEAAILALYDKYDHIQVKEVNGQKYDPFAVSK